jgi:hypothetical protein
MKHNNLKIPEFFFHKMPHRPDKSGLLIYFRSYRHWYETVINMEMLTRSLWITVLAILTLMTSCQKEIVYDDIDGEPPVIIYTIPGGWEGKFGRNFDPPNLYFATHFKADGTLTVEADEPPVYLFGTWQLVGDSVKSTYTFPGGDSFQFSAKFVDTVGRLDGYWRAIPPASGEGTFYLEKY